MIYFYNVIARALSNFLGVRNLYEESWNHILYNIRKLWGLEVPYLDFLEKDVKIIKIYSIIVLIFSIYSVYAFIFYGIPIFSIIFLESIKTIATWSSPNILFQHLVTLVFTGIQLITFMYYIVKTILSLLNQLKQ